MTAIEWTDATWNPTTGCDRVSPGCDHCYAMTMAARLKGMGQEKYQRDGDPRTSGPGFGITEHMSALEAPLHWRKPRKVFVNSMSDLFHQGVSDLFIARVWAIMAATPQHTYQVLTKRHGRMQSFLSDPLLDERVTDAIFGLPYEHRVAAARNSWNREPNRVKLPLPNVWLGVSVEDQKRADLRIPALLRTPAAVRWLSCEPLLGAVDLEWVDSDGITGLTVLEHPPNGIDWVVAGGESGRGARPMHPDWARKLRDQCRKAGVPFLFKQWGSWSETPQPGRPNVLLDFHGAGRIHAHRHQAVELWQAAGKHDTGRELDGRTWDEYPAVAS